MDEQTEAIAGDHVQKLIERIVDPDCRIDAPLWHDGSLYLTDSKILIEVDNHPKPDGAWEAVGGKFVPPSQSERGGRNIGVKALATILDQIGTCDCPMPAVDVAMDELDRFWQTVEDCDECRGRGWATCNMGHDHDCDECDGEGKIATEHPSAMEPVTVDGVRIARRYVWIISQIPGVLAGKANITDGWDALGFKFKGGRGIVMALKKV